MHRHQVKLSALVFDDDVLDGKLPLAGVALRKAFGVRTASCSTVLVSDAKLVEKFEKGAVIVHLKKLCADHDCKVESPAMCSAAAKIMQSALTRRLSPMAASNSFAEPIRISIIDFVNRR